MVGFISNINIKDSADGLDKAVYKLVEESKNQKLSVLVVNGGISSNYLTTLRFVDVISKILEKESIQFRFLCGNTDFYYQESVVDKEGKFRDILSRYRNNQRYLPKHPIIYQDTWIMGFETWYDFSLYRGKPTTLKSIMKKRKLFKKNLDGVYLSNEDDYILGTKNLFDVRYTEECVSEMKRQIDKKLDNMKFPKHLIVSQYFYPSQIFLKNKFLEDYFGTFKGSSKFINVLESRKVTDCIVGMDTDRRNISFEGIHYICSSGKGIVGLNYD